MKNFYKYILIFGAFALILFAGVVLARIEGEGLTLSPPISEVEIKEGESVTKTVRLTNPTENVVEVYPKAMNFRAAGEGGEPEFFDAEKGAERFALAEWISFDQSKIALAPEQVVEFEYTINVPKGAEPGGHYGVVFFATDPPVDEVGATQVALGSMIGSLVLVTVPGQIVEKGIVEEFKSSKEVYLKGPATLTTRIANLGNVHIKPAGEITINGWFGAPENTIKVNEQKGNVLPDSTRRFENKWDFSPYAFGYFTASLNIGYGENQIRLMEEVGFWVVPWWLVIILIFVPLLIVAAVLFKKGKLTKKNKKDAKDDNQGPQGGPPKGPILR